MVRGCKPPEMANDVTNLIANCQIATDEVSVIVDQDGRTVAQQTMIVKIEEDCTAPDKGLEVRSETLWVEPPQPRQQLAFAAGPFQKGTEPLNRIGRGYVTRQPNGARFDDWGSHLRRSVPVTVSKKDAAHR